RYSDPAKWSTTTLSTCNTLLRYSRPCASSSHVATSSTPCVVAAADAAVALTRTSTFTSSLANSDVLRTTTGYSDTSSNPLHTMPNWLPWLSMGGCATRSVTRVAPSVRSIASAARCASCSRPAIGPRGEATVVISTHFLRHVGRQHRLHCRVHQRVREVLQVHRIQGVCFHVERRRRLRIAHNLRARELYLVGDRVKSRRVRDLDLLELQSQRVRQPRYFSRLRARVHAR